MIYMGFVLCGTGSFLGISMRCGVKTVLEAIIVLMHDGFIEISLASFMGTLTEKKYVDCLIFQKILLVKKRPILDISIFILFRFYHNLRITTRVNQKIRTLIQVL